jgi:hypothetical protein
LFVENVRDRVSAIMLSAAPIVRGRGRSGPARPGRPEDLRPAHFKMETGKNRAVLKQCAAQPRRADLHHGLSEGHQRCDGQMRSELL